MMDTLKPMTLAAFERCPAARAKPWQLEDFREHCVDLGIALQRRVMMDWLRMFREHTCQDAELFDADGGGTFEAVKP